MNLVVLCNCGRPAELVTGARLYPHRPDLANLKLWRCEPCDAHVGCRKGTELPLGTLANRDLRQARMEAHAVLDPLWLAADNQKRARSCIYDWLCHRFGYVVHIGSANEELCEKIIEVLEGKTLRGIEGELRDAETNGDNHEDDMWMNPYLDY